MLLVENCFGACTQYMISTHIYLNARWLQSKTTPQKWTVCKKIYFTVNFIHFIHKACKILSTFSIKWHCLHSHCLHHPHSLLTFPSSSLSFHSIPSSVPSIALDPSQSLLVRCAPMPLWSTQTKYYIYISWFINFNLNQWRFTVFFTNGVSDVKNLNTCVLYFCVMSVVWSVWVHGCSYGY